MKPQQTIRRVRAASLIAGRVTVVVAAANILGWVFHSDTLKRGLAGLIAMRPVTACCMIAAGFALVLLQRRDARPARALFGRILAGTVFITGALQLIAIANGWHLDFDQWVFGGLVASDDGPVEPVVTRAAIKLLLTGAALLVLNARTKRGFRPAELIAAILGVIAILALVGYTSGVIQSYKTMGYIPSSLTSSICFLLLAVGILLARAEKGTLAIVVSDTAGGVLARRMVPLAVLLPIFVGAIRITGERAGWYDASFGMAHSATAFIVLYLAAIWWTSRLLFRIDTERRAAAASRDEVYAELEQRVVDRTAELHQINAELERASKAKDDFLAVLSHELRTPLTPALIAASYIAEHADLPDELREEVVGIKRNVQLEARLIDDLLDLTRITRGKLELHLSTVDAHDLVQNTLGIVREDIERKGLVLRADYRAKRSHLMVDPVRIQQVFWNLINNAVKFTPQGGTLMMSTWNDERGGFLFEVTDSGIGIDPDQQGVIFKAFEQGERFITRQFGGLGLGLTISRTLLDLHGGTIQVQSDGRGHGAQFTVSLPTVDAPAAVDPAPATPGAVTRHNLRILAVDDHAETLRVVSLLLGRQGHAVCSAGSVAEAMALLEAHPFDVMISDIGLPDGDGYQLMRAARERHSLRGVALSGFGTEEDVRKSKDAGFDHHLTKPIDFQELERFLAQSGR